MAPKVTEKGVGDVRKREWVTKRGPPRKVETFKNRQRRKGELKPGACDLVVFSDMGKTPKPKKTFRLGNHPTEEEHVTRDSVRGVSAGNKRGGVSSSSAMGI